MQRRQVLDQLATQFSGSFDEITLSREVKRTLALFGQEHHGRLDGLTVDYLTDRLWAIAAGRGLRGISNPVVLFVCVHNAGRFQIAAAPPKRFAGGGYWEAMTGDMAGWFEVRVDGPGRHHYRLFCKLDYAGKNVDKPLLVVIDGRDKPFRTELASRGYQAVRALGDEYLSRNRRSFA